MRPLDVVTAPRRDSRHWEQSTVSWEDILEWVHHPANRKDAGNYLLGTLRATTEQHSSTSSPCTALHRRKGAVVSRSAITLDVDHPDPDFMRRVKALGITLVVHTTYSSTPDSPRYRIIAPTSRGLQPDEYVTACRALMERLGVDQFDPTTDEPWRYMFMPAAQRPEWYMFEEVDAVLLDPDTLLAEFEPDLSSKPFPRLGRNKRDPLELDGVVGAFNRAYCDLSLLIEEYELPYESAGADRWHLVGARSMAGMGPVAPNIYYSHHSSDPAGGKACSAFDLVRLHRFAELDEGSPPQTPVNRLPSHLAMCELATSDPRVTAEIVGADFDADLSDVDQAHSWRLDLRLAPRTGKVLDVIGNWDLIRANDPVFTGLRLNEMTSAVETSADLPWRSLEYGGETFSRVDRAALALYLEREYNVRLARFFVDELVDTTAQEHFYNPLRDYLESLHWDGTPRVETCLPGVSPTDYTRLVARKSLVAAVARVLNPGVKWDHSLVLYGPEGLGKSWWVEKMSRGYSAPLGSISQKDTLLAMQRSWIMIADEGHSMRKTDADVLKEFLTRSSDVFRAPYDRESMAHPRHCVIWSTTNDETFLRRQEGNRRFLIVHCSLPVDFDALTDEYVGQVWAEAVELYRAGEALYLVTEESKTARNARERYVEEDALLGVIEEFLSMRVPEGWDEMSPDARRIWRSNRADGIVAEGTEEQTQTCSAQIWVEALGRRFGDHRRADLLEIASALRRVPGWVALPGRQRMTGYGPQLVFEKM